METNPYITVTGNVTKFQIEGDNRSFIMSPTQYIILTHTTTPFPVHAHFADSASKKRWGAEGPKVTAGSTITIGGTLQRVVREHNIDKPLQFAQVEVSNIAYLNTRGNLTTSPIRKHSICTKNLPLFSFKFPLCNNRRRLSQNSKTMELGRSSHKYIISASTSTISRPVIQNSRQKKTCY